MGVAVSVKNVSKRYRIGLEEKRHETFAAQLGNMVMAPLRNLTKLRSLSKFSNEDESVFWALRDINFEVQEGEVLGIIGHNGAGKSTLLKILSRITEPTEGEITIHGRVSSLLEVGTGFHPDLTGRDNIYMNGTILGMKKKEIDSKLDEIIDFSGVAKYIDTPVKRYSSGMKVRLAFSVAAHLEPEILIIDEVLAVGDAEFQAKCLGKMEDVAGQGRTVLFVSHDMAAVASLCKNAILLQNGRISFNDKVNETINFYLIKNRANEIVLNQEFDLRRYDASNKIELKNIKIESKSEIGAICTGDQLRITLKYLTIDPSISKQINFALTFKDKRGNKLFVVDDIYVRPDSFNHTLGSISFIIDYFPLVPDVYKLDIWVAESGIRLIYIIDELEIRVVPVSSNNFSRVKTREKHGSFVAPYYVQN